MVVQVVAVGQPHDPAAVPDLDHLRPMWRLKGIACSRPAPHGFVVHRHLATSAIDCRGDGHRNRPTGRFPVERATLPGRPGARLRARRRGRLSAAAVHGWPETKRIWWRNIEPLAAAGFEVIVPDLRGFGDSGLAPDGFYDPAAHARATSTRWCTTCSATSAARPRAATSAASSIQDLGLRFEGFVERQCLFNTVPPVLPRRVRGGRHPAGDPARGARGRRLLPPPGPRRRRARRRARHAGRAGAATSRSSTARGSGPRRAAFDAATTSTS